MSHFRARSWTADGELNIPRRNVLQEAEAPLIKQDKSKPRTGPKAIILTQGKNFFLLILSWILFISYVRLSRSGEESVPTITGVVQKKLGTANLHLVVPAHRQDPNLCKLLVSAAVTGYPSPVIAGWNNQTFDEKSSANNSSRVANVLGIHEYLTDLDPYQDDDLVLVVDGYDTWMQLRPQTLIDRYFSINKGADERIANELGRVAHKHNIHQEIIFSSQKECWPWAEDDPPCYAAPQSTLPTDIYGPKTDQDVGEGASPYNRNRPRFLNSGISIGTVRAMRKVFAQANHLLKTDRNMTNGQWVLGHIFGQQELWRESIKRDSILTKGHERFWDDEPEGDPSEEKDQSNTYEFGIGLDYEGLLGGAAIPLEQDTEWLTWSNSRSLDAAARRLGIKADRSHMHILAEDITQTVPPFWTFHNERNLSRWTSWEDVPLLTNIWTGNVPAIIQHPRREQSDHPGPRETWWNQTWFHPRARILYDSSIYEPILPVAYSGYDEGTWKEYWPFERWKAGGRNGAGPWNQHSRAQWEDQKWLGFDRLCNGFHEEVFGDGRGKWILPNVH